MKKLWGSKKLISLIVSLQEAFIAILPFFALTAFITLLYNLLLYLGVSSQFFDINDLKMLMNVLQPFASFMAVISISYFFSIRLKISQIISVILAGSAFITILLFEQHKIPIEMPYGFTPVSLIEPFVAVFVLKKLYPFFSLKLNIKNANHYIFRLFNYIFVFFISYFLVVFLFIVVDDLFSKFFVFFNPLKWDLPNIILLTIRDFMVNVLWLFGIHGSHTINGIFGKEILFQELFQNLTCGEFNRLFVVIGGAGVGIGLLIAMLIYIKDKTLKTITKISIPFTIFNINTLLIYSVVVFNRFLIIPFVVLPLFNLFVAYVVLNLIPVHFTKFYIVWSTPVFVDGYLKSNGNMVVLFLQLFLILIDVYVYAIYVKKFMNSQTNSSHFDVLEKNLEITTEIKAKENIASFKAQQDLIESNIKVDEIVNSLNKNSLFVYYQPKVDAKKKECYKFEALLRYSHNDKLIGPIFLDTLEKAGLAPVVDIWVCKEVKKALQFWKKQKFYPKISVNLHPDTLKSIDAIKKIISILKDENIDFEIIERSFLFKSAENNLLLLKQNGFGISIDDFGTGYSSLSTIAKYNIDELKIDKSLIDIISTNKGYLICKHTTQLSHSLGILVVAEGVESEKQLEIVKEIGVDLVQGYYFSKAISFEEVVLFVDKLKN